MEKTLKPTFEEIAEELEATAVEVRTLPAKGGFDPWAYDINESNYIEIEELHKAIADYQAGKITMSQLLEVINLYTEHIPEIITYKEVAEACRKDFKEVRLLYFDDMHYKSARLKPIRAVVESSEVDKWKWERTYYDCDDFTWALMGEFHHRRDTAAMPIFVASVTYYSRLRKRDVHHRLITFYANGKMTLIEPQNDKFYSVPEGWILKLLIG